MNATDLIDSFTKLPNNEEGVLAISETSASYAKEMVTRLSGRFGEPERVENHEGVALYYKKFKVDVEDADFDIFVGQEHRHFHELESCVTYLCCAGI